MHRVLSLQPAVTIGLSFVSLRVTSGRIGSWFPWSPITSPPARNRALAPYSLPFVAYLTSSPLLVRAPPVPVPFGPGARS